jgi:hypothetical protein
MTTQSVTLQLPEPIYRYFQQVAAATHRPLEQVVRQSIEGNLPPPVATMPPELRDDLSALQSQSVKELLQLAGAQVPAGQQARHQELLDKNSLGTIAPAEQDELAADQLTLRKAYAWAVLRWRGHAAVPLEELLLDQP